jgi:Meiotically up-regulated gene 113
MRERILTEIKRLVTESGKVPGVKVFENETGILRREWTGKIWARWSEAVQEAGFEPNGLTQRFNSEQVLQSVIECCEALGRLPSTNDLRLFTYQNSGFPAHGTIENHYPKRALLVEALRTFSNENPPYAHILEMLPSPVTVDAETPSTSNYGHVYLLKAGDYYKIGQSSDLEKRVKSINVALPDKASLEHAISTDDPPGIETYWHRRFADRRANGEWFKLSKADVLAFKKRKFQ